MLSDRERRELALIEQGLLADDRRFGDGFGPGRAPAGPRRWPARLLVGFGVAVLVISVLTGAGELFVQGLAFAAGGIVWIRWQARRAAAGRSHGPSSGPGTRPRRGTPPEWFRPV
jgi:Flp pilus assembly protein TadB